MDKTTYTVKDLYIRLKKLCLYCGYKTQTSAITKIKISRQVWSMWKDNKRLPNIYQVILLAFFFKTDIEYFFIDDAEPARYVKTITDLEDKLLYRLSLKEINREKGIEMENELPDEMKRIMAEADMKIYSITDFHLRLKELRKFCGYKKASSATNKINISRQVWSLYENGKRKPDISTLVIIAELFKVRIEYFFIPDAKPADYVIGCKEDTNNSGDTDRDNEY